MRRILTLLCTLALPLPALAASCYTHDGSLVRIVALGPSFQIRYETLKPGLEDMGIERRSILFHGDNHGDFLSGSATHIYADCIDQPQQFQVEGPFLHGAAQFTLTGIRWVLEACDITDELVPVTLVFDYSGPC